MLRRFNTVQFTLLAGIPFFLDHRGSNFGNYSWAAGTFLSNGWIGGLLIGGEENRGADGEFSTIDRVAYS